MSLDDQRPFEGFLGESCSSAKLDNEMGRSDEKWQPRFVGDAPAEATQAGAIRATRLNER